jgi:hypothetical protein
VAWRERRLQRRGVAYGLAEERQNRSNGCARLLPAAPNGATALQRQDVEEVVRGSALRLRRRSAGTGTSARPCVSHRHHLTENDGARGSESTAAATIGYGIRKSLSLGGRNCAGPPSRKTIAR